MIYTHTPRLCDELPANEVVITYYRTTYEEASHGLGFSHISFFLSLLAGELHFSDLVL